MTTLLNITNTSQLSDFCAAMIPCIWAGTNDLFHPKRHTAFKNYVYKVLKATQLSCTCIIVALYYIQRLRIAYPLIQASMGSEVRLFTTALMLANKFLDDNTFTNKVTCICLHNINHKTNISLYRHGQKFQQSQSRN